MSKSVGSGRRTKKSTFEELRIKHLDEARQTVERTLEAMAREWLMLRLESFRLDFRIFTQRFDKDAFNAISWSNNIFHFAARYRVCSQIDADLSNGHTVGEVLRAWREHAERSACNQMYRSILPTQNLSEECERAALWWVLVEIESIVRQHADAIATLYCEQEDNDLVYINS